MKIVNRFVFEGKDCEDKDCGWKIFYWLKEDSILGLVGGIFKL